MTPTDPQSPGALEGLFDKYLFARSSAGAVDVEPIKDRLRAALRAADRPETPDEPTEAMVDEALRIRVGNPLVNGETDEVARRIQTRLMLRGALRAAVSRLARGPQQALPEEPSKAAIEAACMDAGHGDAGSGHQDDSDSGWCRTCNRERLKAAYDAERSSASRPQPPSTDQGAET